MIDNVLDPEESASSVCSCLGLSADDGGGVLGAVGDGIGAVCSCLSSLNVRHFTKQRLDDNQMVSFISKEY